jgi:hypothetical protein
LVSRPVIPAPLRPPPRLDFRRHRPLHHLMVPQLGTLLRLRQPLRPDLRQRGSLIHRLVPRPVILPSLQQPLRQRHHSLICRLVPRPVILPSLFSRHRGILKKTAVWSQAVRRDLRWMSRLPFQQQ